MGKLNIKVRKDVPLPDPDEARSEKLCKYPWNDMEVGDSFVFPEDTLDVTARSLARVQSRRGKKFVARTTKEGMAAWRTA